jgi:hypothetical protein
MNYALDAGKIIIITIIIIIAVEPWSRRRLRGG